MRDTGKLVYWTAARVPSPVLERAQAIAARRSPASILLRRLTSGARSGVREIASGPARGLRIDLADSRPSYVLGTAELGLQQFMVDHVRPGGVFYDLGANVGYFTLIAARLVGAEGHVRAYEPLPTNAAALRRSVALNGLSNVTVIEAAVASAVGTASFQPGPTGQDGRLGAGDLEVQTRAVDADVQDGAPPPSVVKIDVEGAEHDALLGMRATLTEHRPVIVCEMHDDPWDLDQNPVPVLLSGLGYDVAWLEGEIGEEFWAPHLVAIPVHRNHD
jgi:FkbM family methyltransferase